ncbi:MAG: trypsin-like peptidase domain-containing protein, partial [Anaerolineae bacterium]|nr:trypsin-like peptidase domain-containing protein [Anaerolineae bacterium]
MRKKLQALAAAGLLVLALTACLPCGVPSGTARQAPAPTPSPTTPASPGSPGGLADQDQWLVDLYQRAGPAVVNVRVTKQADAGLRFQPEQGEPPDELVRGQGSGFVIDRDGHIVTNYHVVEGAAEVLVIFSDGDQARGTVVGS